MAKPIKALIVEDSEDDMLLLLRELKKGGFKPTHKRVETAAAMKKALKENWDVILADYKMPRFSAPEALKVLQSTKLDIPFIIVSGSVGEDTAVETLKAGAHDFITKMNLSRLIPAIEREMQDWKMRQEGEQSKIALEESEHRYKHLFQNHPNPMWVYDIATLKFIDVNNVAIEKYGFSREEFLSMTLLDIRPKQDYQSLRENLAKRRLAREHSEEWRHQLKNGEIIYVDIDSYLFEENGKKMALVSVNDITERRAAESKLKDSEQRYQTLAKISPVGIFRTDATGYTTYVNPRWCQISGLSAEEALGDGWLKAVHKDDKEKLDKGWKEAVRIRKESHSEYRFVQPDGTVAWVMGEVAPEKNIKNQIVGYVGTITDITARRQTEEALRDSEDKFRNLIENINDSFYISDHNGKLMYCSPNLFTSTGYSQKEIIGNSYTRIVAPVDRRAVVNHYLIKANDGTIDTKLEFRVRCKDGKILWVEQNTRIVRDSGGKVIEYRNVTRDIGERKKAEAALRESEEKFRFLAENSNDIIFRLRRKPTLRFDYVSPAVTRISGYTPEEHYENPLIGMKLVHPDDIHFLVDSIKPGNFLYHAIVRWIKKDGTLIWTEHNNVPIYDKQGELVAVEGIVRDVTQRKIAEDALRASETEMRALFASMNDVIFVLNSEGRYIKIAPTNPSLLYKPSEEILGKTLHEVFPTDAADFFLDKIQNSLKSNKTVSVEYDLEIGGKKIYFFGTVSPMTKDSVIWIARDITERKQAEKDRAESEKRYKEVVETATEIIYTTDVAGKFLYVNTAGLKKIGYTLEEMQRLNYIDLTHPEHKKRVKYFYYKQYLEKNLSSYIEFPFRTKSGEVGWFGQSGTLLIENDKVVGFQLIARDITDLKIAEEALRASESKFRTVAETSAAAIFIFQGEKFVYWNPASEAITGYSDLDLKDLRFWDLIHPDYREITKERGLARQRGEDVPSRYEFKIIKKNGEERWLDFAAGVIQFEGKPAALGIAFDITGRKNIESELQKSAASYKKLFDEDLTANYISTPEGKLLLCNPAFLKMMEFDTMEEAFSVNPEVLYSQKEERNNFLELLRKNKKIELFETKLFTKKGRKLNVIENVIGTFDSNGKLISFQGYMFDITARKQFEEALMKSEERYRSLFDRMMDGVYRSSHEGKFVEVNPAMVQMFGYSSREEMLNVDIKKELYFAPSERDSLFLDTGQERTETFRMRHKNGSEIWVEDHGSYVHDEKGNVIFHEGILRDVTQRLLAEAELKKSEEKYRDIFTWAPIGIYQSSVDGKLLTVNKCLADMLGYDDTEELLGCKFATDIYYNEAERQRLLDEFNRGEKGSVTNFEILWKKKDGSLIWILLTSHAVTDAKGKILYYEGFVADITNRKLVEEELRKKEDRMRLLVEGTPYLFFYTQDTVGKVTYVSPSVEKITGRSINEWLNQSHWFVTDNKINEYARERTHAHLRGEFTQGAILVEVEHADKHAILLEVFESPIILDGKVVGTQGIAHDITERKKSELALQESERKLTTLVGNLPGMAYSCMSDRDWTMKYVSPGCYELTGYKPEDLIDNKKLSFNDLIDENHRERLWNKWQEVLNNKKIFQDEYPIITANGEKKWVWEQGCGIYSSTGEVISIEGLIIDITERKQAVEAMLKLSKAVESSGEVIFMTDPNGIFTYVNPEFTKLYGYEPDVVIGKSTPRILKSDTMKLDEYNVLWNSLFSKQIVKREIVNKSKNGNLIDVEVAINPVTDDKQNIIGFLAIQKDITERKKAEEALKLQTTYFTQLFENSPFGIAFLDTNDRIMNINKAFENIFQYSVEEIKGKSLTPLIVPDEFVKESYSLSTRVINGELMRSEAVRKRKDGTRLDFVITGYPIMIGGKCVGIYAIYADVSEVKKLEDQVRQNQKLESIGTLAGGIAHDFNNILGIILGYTSLLEYGAATPEKVKQSVDAITRAVNRGAGLVKQILTFARKTNVIVEPVDLNASINELVKMMNETFPKTITFSLDLEENLTPIIADHNQIHQALLNLSVNARDAILSHTAKSHAGTITFVTKKITGRELRKKIPEAIDENYACISVTDSGCGMDATTLTRIFEPFFTTKEQGKGTGLGLSVVYGVVKSNRGYVDVESELGVGTTFALYFPIESDEIVPEKVEAESEMQAVTGSETILFVEDEEMLQEVVKAQLSNNGYRVISAFDGEQAVEMYRKHQNEIAVVLSDLGLPKLGGFDAFLQMKKINPGAQVILASGFFDPSQKSAMLEAGVEYFVQKPYKANEILSAIRKLLDKK